MTFHNKLRTYKTKSTMVVVVLMNSQDERHGRITAVGTDYIELEGASSSRHFLIPLAAICIIGPSDGPSTGSSAY
jgi:hypothetical protein